MEMRFEDLQVWKRSARLCANIYKELRDLSDYSFKRQITRAGLSISSNIAEGYERESKKETLNFLSYAKGSCGELRSQIYIGMEINYIAKNTGQNWIKEAQQISSMLKCLIQTRKKFLNIDEM